MIIFYERKTGKIVGTIDGRIHGEDHLKIYQGNPKEIDRMVVQWKPSYFIDREGNVVNKDDIDGNGLRLAAAADFEPDHIQSDIFFSLDKKPLDIYTYKVDLKKKKLVPK